MSTQPSPTATATEADAHRLTPITQHHILAEKLNRFDSLKKERAAIDRQIIDLQDELIDDLEVNHNGSLRPVLGGKVFTVVRAKRKLIDTALALQVIRRRRLASKLTKIVVDEDAFRKLADTGLFPEFDTAISVQENAPFIKIS